MAGLVACVQTPPPPSKNPIFTEGGGGLYTSYVLRFSVLSLSGYVILHKSKNSAKAINVTSNSFVPRAELGIFLWRGRGRGRGRQLFMGGGNLPTLLKAIFATLSRRCVYCHDTRGIC